ncbi:hypothetical protein KFK09_008279 [Dendrobium nobile]|uniref:Transmembrane protein n=1 Tax=Dendrobium nobile TaxID=94219 RepID=A0A8T3BJR8_DENNO|nr:hypothetical protein KFK09_008279 [Dendrobium nobile]
MADWGPVVIAVVLFVFLTPGLLFQLPGNGRVVEFANMRTSVISILIHAVIYFALITIFLIAIGVHITTVEIFVFVLCLPVELDESISWLLELPFDIVSDWILRLFWSTIR